MLSALRSLWLPALVCLLVLAWVRMDSVMGWKGIRVPWLGLVMIVAGVLLAAWCAALFLFVGKGTPLPFELKTKHLVTRGPYGVVRNPMMWGVGSFLVGLALWLGSLGLWFGFAAFLIFVSFFVHGYEEPDMRKRFGEEYLEYCRRVPRWWPRLRSK